MKLLVKLLQPCLMLCNPMDRSPPGSSVHGDSPGKNTGMGCHALLQGIFPAQGWHPVLPHYRRILYCLSHQGSPRILVWVAYLFSRETSQPRNQTGVSYIASGFLPAGPPGKLWRYSGAVQSLRVTLDCLCLVVVLLAKVLFYFVSCFIRQLWSYPVLNLLLSMHSQVCFNSIFNYLFSRG